MITMHPGEYIVGVYLEPQNLTRTELAKKLNVNPSTISRILAAKSEVTPDMALRLQHVLGRSAESWIAMQTAFSLEQAKSKFDSSCLAGV
jgi:addiction module HigA family antidote